MLLLLLMLGMAYPAHSRHPDTFNFVPTWATTTLNDGNEVSLATNESIRIYKNVSILYNTNYVITFTYASDEDALFSIEATIGESYAKDIVMFSEDSMSESIHISVLYQGDFNMELLMTGLGSGSGRVLIESIELSADTSVPLLKIILGVLIAVGTLAVVFSIGYTIKNIRDTDCCTSRSAC